MLEISPGYPGPLIGTKYIRDISGIYLGYIPDIYLFDLK